MSRFLDLISGRPAPKLNILSDPSPVSSPVESDPTPDVPKSIENILISGENFGEEIEKQSSLRQIKIKKEEE